LLPLASIAHELGIAYADRLKGIIWKRSGKIRKFLRWKEDGGISRKMKKNVHFEGHVRTVDIALVGTVGCMN